MFHANLHDLGKKEKRKKEKERKKVRKKERKKERKNELKMSAVYFHHQTGTSHAVSWS